MGYINSAQIEQLASPQVKSGYGKYLLDMLKYDVRGALKSST
jgi:hypothetical protein